MALAQNVTYTATGAEGSIIVLNILVGQKILLCLLGDKILVSKPSAPTVNDFVFDSASGTLTFGSVVQASQVLQVVYRNP